MKFALVAVVLAFVLVVGAEEKRCGSADDCSEEECCIVRGFLGWQKGDCKKRAQEGEDCSQEKEKYKVVHGEQYVLHCPCASGHQCEVTKVQELPIFGNVTIEQKCSANV